MSGRNLLIQPFIIMEGFYILFNVHISFSRETNLQGKCLVKRDLLSKMRMRLESGRERIVRDNWYIAVFRISDVRLSRYFF